MGKLSDRKIRALALPGLYGDGDNLYLRVAVGLSRSWVLRYMTQGKRTDHGLGGYPVVSLAKARVRAFELRQKLAQGIDPIAEKRANRLKTRIPTLAEALDKVLALHAREWRGHARTERQWRATMANHVLPTLGTRTIDSIVTRDLLNVLGELWHEKRATAQRLQHRLSAIFRWGMAHGHVTANPCDGLSMVLPRASKPKAHFKALPHADVGAALAVIRAKGQYRQAVLCFELCVATACRSHEAREMLWSEVDVAQHMWTIPAHKTKMQREFKIPLNAKALGVLTEAQAFRQSSDLVFPSKRNKVLADTFLSKLTRDQGIPGTVHGIARASFRSWCSDVGVAREVAEACLSHFPKGVEGCYVRTDFYDRRAVVMQRWGDYLDGNRQGQVVELRRA